MSARDAAGSKAARPLAPIAVLEPQGERRRRQLVEIASRMIEQEGADAVRIPRIAELAERVAIKDAPPAQACVRLGLPADFLYRSKDTQARLLANLHAPEAAIAAE